MPRLLAALAVLAASLPLMSAADTPRGYRYDGSGHFPAKVVPVDFDVAAGKGLLWKADLPETGTSEPVFAGDVVLVSCEPDLLVCLNAADGMERWRATFSALGKLKPEEQARAQGILKAVVDVWKSGKDIDSLTKTKDEAGQQLKKDLEFLKKPCGIEPLRRWLFMWVGYAAVPPVTDGVHAWIKYGTGAIGCVEVKTGKVVWSGMMPEPSGLVVQGTVMQVIDGKMVFVSCLPRNPTQGDPKTDHCLVGLDALTGKEAWRSKPFTKGDHGNGGGLLTLTVGDKAFLATSNGQVIDPASGEILLKGLGNCGYHASASALPDTLVFGPARVRLSLEDGKPKALDPSPDFSKTGDQGILVGETIFIAGPTGLKIVDANQRPAEKEKLKSLAFFQAEGRNKRAPGLPILADGRLYCPATEGKLAIVDPGPEPKLIGVRDFPGGITAGCAASDGRLYVRTATTLYCLGK